MTNQGISCGYFDVPMFLEGPRALGHAKMVTLILFCPEISGMDILRVNLRRHNPWWKDVTYLSQQIHRKLMVLDIEYPNVVTTLKDNGYKATLPIETAQVISSECTLFRAKERLGVARRRFHLRLKEIRKVKE